MKAKIHFIANSDPKLVSHLTYILAKSKINIDDINVITLGDKTYIDLEVSDERKAIKVLKANGFQPSVSECIIIQLEDKPGELAKVSKILLDNKVEINRVDIIAKGLGRSILALDVNKPKKAKTLLKKYLI